MKRRDHATREELALVAEEKGAALEPTKLVSQKYRERVHTYPYDVQFHY